MLLVAVMSLLLASIVLAETPGTFNPNQLNGNPNQPIGLPKKGDFYAEYRKQNEASVKSIQKSMKKVQKARKKATKKGKTLKKGESVTNSDGTVTYKNNNGDVVVADGDYVKQAQDAQQGNDSENEGGSHYQDLPLTYDAFKDHLSRFTSKTWFGNDILGLGSETLYLINSFVQAIFWVTKLIFQICAQIYEFLATDVVGSYFEKVLNAAAGIFSQFKTALLPLVGISMGSYLAYLYFVRNESFFKNLLKLLVLFALATCFFMKNAEGKYVIQRFYENTRDVTSELAKLAITSTKDLTEDGFSSESSSVVLDRYF